MPWQRRKDGTRLEWIAAALALCLLALVVAITLYFAVVH